MRHAFSGVPEDDTRKLLGENAVKAYGLGLSSLRSVADRIGPTAEELALPLHEDEFPSFRSAAFRAAGHWSS
jgi:hypothetical protein